MPMQPLFDKVVVIPLEVDTQSEGGIILTKLDDPTKGKVIAVGPGRILETGERIPPSVNIGDVVIYPKGTGQLLQIDNESVLIFTEEQILGIYRNQ